MTNRDVKSKTGAFAAAILGANIAFATPAVANNIATHAAPAIGQAADADLVHQANFKFKVSKRIGHSRFGHSRFGHSQFGHKKFGHGKVVQKKFAPRHGFGRGTIVIKSGKGFVVKHPGFKRTFVVKKKLF